MKKILFSLALVTTMSVANAQTVVFNETFDNPTGWVITDLDGDGFEWDQFNLSQPVNGFTGFIMGSASYDDDMGDDLTPNNLLASPSITLPATGPLNLRFTIGAADPLWAAEHYAVYILPAATAFTATATPVKEATLTSATSTAAVQTVAIPNSLYGQAVKIYFRHFNCTGQYYLLLDDVKVLQGVLATNEIDAKNSAIAVYPNPTTDVLNINTKERVKSVVAYDMSGKKVATKLEGTSVDVRNLEKGAYTIVIETNKETQTTKFIKK